MQVIFCVEMLGVGFLVPIRRWRQIALHAFRALIDLVFVPIERNVRVVVLEYVARYWSLKMAVDIMTLSSRPSQFESSSDVLETLQGLIGNTSSSELFFIQELSLSHNYQNGYDVDCCLAFHL